MRAKDTEAMASSDVPLGDVNHTTGRIDEHLSPLALDRATSNRFSKLSLDKMKFWCLHDRHDDAVLANR